MVTVRLSPEIAKKIRHIEIYTKRLVSGSLVGDSRSALKGTGFEFDQIREYQLGDDVRCIDWKSSARSNRLLVKQYREERSREIILVMDMSQSNFFTSCNDTYKQDLLAQIASALALVADYGKDRVGLIIFTDTVEYYMPPRKGRSHIRSIMELLFGYKPTSKKTSLSVVFEYLAKLRRKNSMIFVFSDFIDENFETYLPIVSRLYDCIIVRYLDMLEQQMPSVGFLTVQDIETNGITLLDTRSGHHNPLNTFLHMRVREQDHVFKRYKMDVLTLVQKQSMISDMVRFFRRRMKY